MDSTIHLDLEDRHGMSVFLTLFLTAPRAYVSEHLQTLLTADAKRSFVHVVCHNAYVVLKGPRSTDAIPVSLMILGKPSRKTGSLLSKRGRTVLTIAFPTADPEREQTTRLTLDDESFEGLRPDSVSRNVLLSRWGLEDETPNVSLTSSGLKRKSPSSCVGLLSLKGLDELTGSSCLAQKASAKRTRLSRLEESPPSLVAGGTERVPSLLHLLEEGKGAFPFKAKEFPKP